MATNKPRLYFDSCCFIELVKSETGKSIEQGRGNDVWFIKQLLKASADRDIEAYTSTLSVAECTHSDGDISEEVQALFMRFLTSGKHVVLIQPDVFVAEDARDLRWTHGIPLSGADALHVASALSVECKEFLTIESADTRKGPLRQKDKIARLGMSVIAPSETGLLSDEYRQMDAPGMPTLPTMPAKRRLKIPKP